MGITQFPQRSGDYDLGLPLDEYSISAPAAQATGVSATASETHIYIFRRGDTVIRAFDVINKTWSNLPTALPAPNVNIELTYADGRLIIQNGSNYTKVYNLATNALTDMALPPGETLNNLGFASLEWDFGTYVYAKIAEKLYRYTVSSNSWTTVSLLAFPSSIGENMAYLKPIDMLVVFNNAYGFNVKTGRQTVGMFANNSAGEGAAVDSAIYMGEGRYVYLHNSQNGTGFFKRDIYTGEQVTVLSTFAGNYGAGGAYGVTPRTGIMYAVEYTGGVDNPKTGNIAIGRGIMYK